ncbi:MAG TPA: VCBS repeat-containing protein, partial [Polyangiaceae bacterium]
RMKCAILVTALAGTFASAAQAATFTPIAEESGLSALRAQRPADFWLSGLTFVDLDHDGDLDLFLADHHGDALAAVNDGSGHFIAAAGDYPTSEVHLCLDVDEDGRVDMDLTYSDGGAKWWLNGAEPGGTLAFTDVGEVNTREGNESRSEALVDLNRDGLLDWARTCQGQNFKVDFGDGAGHFEKDSLSIPQPEGNALDAGLIFADLDADGDEDLVVNWGGYDAPGGDDYGRARVLLNDGTMNLVEKTTELGIPPEHLAILGVGDVDHDGDVDLIGLEDRRFPEVIYLNDGRGSFTKLEGAVTGSSGSAQYALWGLATLTDLDNDGIADILIDGRYYFHVLRGTGGGHFAYQNDAWGGITDTAEASVDGGFAFGDIDADGDLDLIGYTATDPNRQVELYRNDLPARNWLNVRPVGAPGNLSGVSSKIRIYEANTDRLLWYEEVLAYSKQAQQNYYAFDELERHYGLDARETVDVTITFYPSGTTVRKDGVERNTTIWLAEDGSNGVIEPPAAGGAAGAGGAGTSGASAGGAGSGGAGSGGATGGGAGMGMGRGG